MTYVFSHEVGEPPWYEDISSPAVWEEETTPQVAIAYASKLFERPQILQSRFSHAQIGQGLLYVAEPAFSDHLTSLHNSSVPWVERKRCICSMYVLYRDLFAPACTDQLGHVLQEQETPDPLNSICYMWWDTVPLWPGDSTDEDARMRRAIAWVLRSIIRLPSLACQEGALHGVGTYSALFPEVACQIVDEYLKNVGPGSSVLRAYAKRAAKGDIR